MRGSGESASAPNATEIRRGIPQVTGALRLVAGVALALVVGVIPSRATESLDLALLESAVLAVELDAWAILDARPLAAYHDAHIPGARSFSWEDHTRTDESGVPSQPWPAAELATALGAMGIDEATPVVVYGDASSSWGGEGWACWVLAWLGHRGPVRLLAGGIDAWRNEGRELESGRAGAVARQRVYRAETRPDVRVELAALRAAGQAFSLVDTRSPEEWRRGVIPGATHIPWERFFAGDDRRPLEPEATRSLLRERGVDTERPVVYYCASGVRSAYAWLVHELSGLPPALNYEGGMEEWQATRQATSGE